ncbi:(R)-mandelonitrile lyase 1 isoform X1 [Ziziphus jujuba]|uniref:(R)-mandelonitrile lyase n=1 Tax=Ziziphus jujuba TaxID=326968 RepID=A0A6P3ZU06_ZIZJJ|nr:(R)-mandelonitrile lyase 1 isoform X1 [Ziziphus jujuba]
MASLLLLLLLHIFHPQSNVHAFATSSDHDFSYMKSVHSANDLPAQEEYDYIVIGGGTAGCSLAATLSAKYSVLVLERGSVPAAYPSVLNANGLLANFIQEDDGKTPAQRFISEDGVENVRGRILGGSSMINIGFYSRANPEFYRNSGIQWNMDMVEKSYQWVEDSIVFHSELVAWQSFFRDALLEAGIRPYNGFALNHMVGTKIGGSIFDDKGRRHGAVELLNKADFKNLRVAVHATVEKIIFSSNASSLSATGVLYSDSNGESHTAFIRNRGEVILSAGAIGSPQLLLLSGVGPVPHLSSLNIPVIHPQSHVGSFMADNPRNNINFVIPFPLNSTTQQAVGITKEYYIEGISHKYPFPFNPPFSFLPNSSSPLDLSLAIISGKFPGPLSNGFLWLASSADVRTNPIVRFNYFANPADLSRCVAAMRKIGDILETEAMHRFKYRDLKGSKGFKFLEMPLPMNQSDDSSMEEFCRKTVTTFWHYHGGCLVGKVVDGNFKVMGTSSLRVVDASTFTTTPGTNPQATIMMLGRYVGLKMLQERSSQSN